MVRKYHRSDLDAIIELFHDTIHAINAQDYSREQLEAWAPASVDVDSWHKQLSSSLTYVAEDNGAIVGFGNLTSDGWVDMLYIHKDHQREGIGTAILSKLIEDAGPLKFTALRTEASTTARPFFEARGFQLEKEQEKTYSGTLFRNSVMIKKLV